MDRRLQTTSTVDGRLPARLTTVRRRRRLGTGSRMFGKAIAPAVLAGPVEMRVHVTIHTQVPAGCRDREE
ncbi:MAG: hypothetical protein ACYC0H_20480 [Solirubrobacteraceae bacterium]